MLSRCRLGGATGFRARTAELGGKPLVAHAVGVGLAARLVSRVLCSTDDPDIAAAAQAAGAEVPFLRPAELARDNSEDWPVFVHALNWLERAENWRPDLIVNLRPTATAVAAMSTSNPLLRTPFRLGQSGLWPARIRTNVGSVRHTAASSRI